MGEKSEPAAKNSIAALKKGALDLIASRPEGIYQSDLRRLLEIDSSKCSKVVSRLQRSGLIRREKVPASSTYLLKLSSASTPSPATFTSTASPASPASAINTDPQTNGSNPGNAANIDSDIRGLVHDGRIKRMIDRQIKRLLDKRIYSQLNSRIYSPLGNIENAIDSSKNSSLLGERSISIKREINGPIDCNKTDPIIGSYYDCYTGDNLNNQSDEDIDIGGRIEGFFYNCRSVDHHSHIDTYLTEIYLLYLTRATSF